MSKWETSPGAKPSPFPEFGGSTSELEWENFIERQARGLGAMEISAACLYSTIRISNGDTRGHAVFFQSPPAELNTNSKTNVYIPGMLPAPQSFLIHTVKLFGLVSSMLLTSFTIQLASKHYVRRPSWLCSVRRGSVLDPRLFIPPLVAFRADIEWDGAFDAGASIDGSPRSSCLVQVAFVGKVSRPLQ